MVGAGMTCAFAWYSSNTSPRRRARSAPTVACMRMTAWRLGTGGGV